MWMVSSAIRSADRDSTRDNPDIPNRHSRYTRMYS